MKKILLIIILFANIAFAQQEQPFANKVGALRYLVARPTVQDLNISGTVTKWHSVVRIGTTPLTNNITIVLPQNTLNEKGYIELKRIDGAAYTVTIVAFAGDVVNITNPTALNSQGGSIILRSVSATRSEQVGGLSPSVTSNDANAQMFTDNTPTQITNGTNITESAQIRRSGVTVLGSTAVGVTDANAKLKVVGNIELDESTSTTGNITKGGLRFLHNANNNSSVYLGSDAGNLSSSSGFNVGIGSASLSNNQTSGTHNIGIGYGSLGLLQTGTRNIGIGYNAIAYSNVADNIGIGQESGYFNTSGIQNVSIGNYSMYNNRASKNLAIGYSSLGNTGINTTAGSFVVGTTYRIISAGTTNYTLIGSVNNSSGTYFVASGIGSGTGTALPMITGEYNIAIGNNVLSKNTTGNGNTGIGYQSLLNNTTGVNMTAIGYETLRNNTTGFNNTANGFVALQSNTTGSNNTGIGYNSLQVNTTASNNTGLGYASLAFNTTGSSNTALGSSSSYYNLTGSFNTSIGHQSLLTNLASNNIGIGYFALGNTTNTDAGNFVIGTTYKIISVGSTDFTLIGSPDNNSGTNFVATGVGSGSGIARAMVTGVRNLSIGNNTLSKNTTGYYNTVVGQDAGIAITTSFQNTGVGSESFYLTTTGSNHTAVGHGAGYNILTGVNSVFLGNYAGRNVSQLTSASNSIAIGANTFTTASNQAVIGDVNITQTILRGQVTLRSYTVATLPTGITGSIAFVTDASAPSYGVTAVGGGSVGKMVLFDGVSWKIN